MDLLREFASPWSFEPEDSQTCAAFLLMPRRTAERIRRGLIRTIAGVFDEEDWEALKGATSPIDEEIRVASRFARWLEDRRGRPLSLDMLDDLVKKPSIPQSGLDVALARSFAVAARRHFLKHGHSLPTGEELAEWFIRSGVPDAFWRIAHTLLWAELRESKQA